MSDILEEPPDDNEVFENLDEALDEVDLEQGSPEVLKVSVISTRNWSSTGSNSRKQAQTSATPMRSLCCQGPWTTQSPRAS
jgi:hypothetical protein